MIEVAMLRGFAVAKGFEDKEINLPTRATKNSAGYDFECAEDTIIAPCRIDVLDMDIEKTTDLGDDVQFHQFGDPYITAQYNPPVLVPTGVKAYMQSDEGLFLYNRSSNPLKKGLVLANGVGVVDSDYFGNPSNDGHIMFQFYNFTDKPITIKKGDKIGQGVFQKFFVAFGDNANNERTGGFGSTNV